MNKIVFKLYILFFGLLSSYTTLFSQEKIQDSHHTPYIIGSIGDSITTGLNSTHWGENKGINWSTGTKQKELLMSHYHRLTDLVERNVVSVNVARSGAVSRGIIRQAQDLSERHPDYVTILIGGNDVCSWSHDYDNELLQYERNVKQSIEILLASNEDVKILLIPIPDMHHLWKVGHDNGCQLRWDLFGMCNALLHSNRTDEERLAFKRRVEKANDTLQVIANNYEENVRFDHSIADYKFQWSEVSPHDCFHPSLKGHKLISQMTWESGWFN